MNKYGLILDEVTPDQYVVGGLISLPKEVVNPSGDWTEWLPTYEPQSNKAYDTYGCTVFGTQNCIETMLKHRDGKDYNYSERYNYILAGIRPPGYSPHKLAEIIRAEGVIENSLLPMTETYEEFITPDPMRADLLIKGQQWPYSFQHEWVWSSSISKSKRKKLIEEYLKYSPLGVTVTAWYEKDGVYIDKGLPNTHWCVLYGIDKKGFKIFDSYDHSHKILSFDHNIQCCKRYYLKDKPMSQNVYKDILKRLIDFLKDLVARASGAIMGK